MTICPECKGVGGYHSAWCRSRPVTPGEQGPIVPEVERLRALLAEALNEWEPNARSHCTNGDRPGCTYEDCDCVYDIARIRREAGLS